jgi:hypothetical protein
VSPRAGLSVLKDRKNLVPRLRFETPTVRSLAYSLYRVVVVVVVVVVVGGGGGGGGGGGVLCNFMTSIGRHFLLNISAPCKVLFIHPITI